MRPVKWSLVKGDQPQASEAVQIRTVKFRQRDRFHLALMNNKFEKSNPNFETVSNFQNSNELNKYMQSVPIPVFGALENLSLEFVWSFDIRI